MNCSAYWSSSIDMAVQPERPGDFGDQNGPDTGCEDVCTFSCAGAADCDDAECGSPVRAMAIEPRTFFKPFLASFSIGLRVVRWAYGEKSCG